MLVAAQMKRTDLAVSSPLDPRLGVEKLGAHRGQGNGEVLELWAAGQERAEVLVVGHASRVRVPKAVHRARGVLEHAQGLLRGAHDGHDAFDRNGRNARDLEFFETGGGARDRFEIGVVDGEIGCVAEEFEASQVLEVDQARIERVLVGYFVSCFLLLLGEIDGQKFERAKRLGVIFTQYGCPFTGGAMSQRCPGKAERRKVVTRLDCG